MPLPINNAQEWPPIDRGVADKFQEWAAWYSGNPETIMAVMASKAMTPTPEGAFWAKKEIEERQVMLHVPIASDIAKTSADLLFSEAPTFTIPEAHGEAAQEAAKPTQARLDYIIERSGLHNRLLEAAETASPMGGVYLKPNWDRDLMDVPFMTVVQADQAVPDFRFGILASVTFWKIVKDDGSNVWRHLERHEVSGGNAVIFHGLYRGTSRHLGQRVALTDHPETAGLTDVVNPGVKGLDVRYVPNMRPNRLWRNSALGCSDIAGVEGLMDALDEVFTSWIRDIRLGVGRIIVPDSFLKRDADGKLAFDVDKQVFTALDIDPLTAKEGGGITLSQFAIRFAEHDGTALRLIQQIVNGAGYSPQTFGLHADGGIKTATEIKAQQAKSFATKAKKERYFKAAVEDVIHMMLQVDREVFKTGGVNPQYRPSMAYADNAAPDERTVAETVELWKRAQGASTYVIVKKLHPDWSEKQIQEEVARITEENKPPVIEEPFNMA